MLGSLPQMTPIERTVFDWDCHNVWKLKQDVLLWNYSQAMVFPAKQTAPLSHSDEKTSRSAPPARMCTVNLCEGDECQHHRWDGEIHLNEGTSLNLRGHERDERKYK